MRGRNNNNNGGNNNNNNNRRGPNPLTRNYESNGPDVKIRGSAQQIAEKYTTLARDSHSSGDRVMAENYLQHAEHYNRIIAAAQAQLPIQNMQQSRNDMDDDYDDDRDDFDQGSGFGGDPASPNFNAQGNPGQQNLGQNGQGRNNQGPINQGVNNHGQYDQSQQSLGQYGQGPQPVIEGLPAQVALNPQVSGDGGGGRNREREFNRDRNRERGRPRDQDRDGAGRDRDGEGRDGAGRDGTGREGGGNFAGGGYQAPAVAELVAEVSRSGANTLVSDEGAGDPASDPDRPRRGRRPRRRESRSERDALAAGDNGRADDGDSDGDGGGPGLVPVEG